MPRKYKKKTERQKLIEANDALAREINKIIHENKCEWCGRDGEHYKLDWSHVESREILALRWLEINSMLHCFRCHKDWHHRPRKQGEKFDKIYGPERGKELDRLQQNLKPVSVPDLRKINARLKRRRDSLV